MKHLLTTFALLSAFATPLSACAHETAPAEQMRQYMFIADIGPEGWQQLIDSPSNREAAARESISKLGGELVGYYFGFGNSKNYVIVNLPNKETAKAIQVLRLSSGMLIDYEIIELMSSSEIETIAKSMQKLRDVDDIQNED
ncbi:GYD domain-containing protein [Hellea sp.]|nr:GYD domain-containing protein [Hellea sp.]MDB4845240.1 GYD domain-containing protein [Hellea sp.]